MLLKERNRGKGFALVEVLIALAILSIVLMSVFTGITTTIHVMSGIKNHTKAMLIAKSRMNEFILNRMRGTDISAKNVEEYNGFYESRTTERYEHILLGPVTAKKTTITISWKDKNIERKYSVFYIYPVK